MADLECRVGGLDPKLPLAEATFVVYGVENRVLEIYALQKKHITHYDVVSHFKLTSEKVLGGGTYEVVGDDKESTLYLDDFSAQYGSIPKEVGTLVEKALSDHFKQKHKVTIKETNNEMKLLFPNDRNKKVWLSLGFSL